MLKAFLAATFGFVSSLKRWAGTINDISVQSVRKCTILLFNSPYSYAFKSGPIFSATYFFPTLDTNTVGF